ncbi:sulfite exporter TauE/SafE family protein [Iamia sp.]|uniref:sulfite exporter TauE/SafE family protein n=1 Tax=Iamia sp. TaxID=2722710 RepID=UPI002C912209|nr:sulfite exporter TauE/SafE family protein [Iamia sp.]HXH55727.1 sulfite exporter TauE/SafE family protein [Iamia sp.]
MQLVLAAGVVALGATVQRTLGFGAALVAVPLLLIIDPRLVPGPIAIAGIALVVLMSVGTSGDADWRGVRWMVLGLVPGTAAAGLALLTLSPDLLALTAGAIVLVAVAAVATRSHVRIGRRSLLGSGALAGFMGTTAGVGGPPIALLYSSATGSTLRATLARVFLASSVMTVATLALTHRLGATELSAGLAMMPGGPLGLLAGRKVSARVDASRLRIGVLVVSAASALVAIARVVL